MQFAILLCFAFFSLIQRTFVYGFCSKCVLYAFANKLEFNFASVEDFLALKSEYRHSCFSCCILWRMVCIHNSVRSCLDSGSQFTSQNIENTFELHDEQMRVFNSIANVQYTVLLRSQHILEMDAFFYHFKRDQWSDNSDCTFFSDGSKNIEIFVASSYSLFF